MKSILNKAKIFLLLLIICPLQIYAANPPIICDGVLISDAPWELDAQHEINTKRISDIVAGVVKFIPNAPKPGFSGVIRWSTFSKTGCCTKLDTTPTTLKKASVEGRVVASVDTGQLPLPGVSIPGVGGVFIQAKASIFVGLTSSLEQTCDQRDVEFCFGAVAGGSVSIGGGVNILSGILSAGLDGRLTVSGSGEFCDGVFDPKDIGVRGDVSVVVNTPFGTSRYVIAQFNS